MVCAAQISVLKVPFPNQKPVRGLLLLVVSLAAILWVPLPCLWAQVAETDWQSEVRRDVEAHRWDEALRVINGQIDRFPEDMDIRAWRARVLEWAGRLPEAQKEFEQVLKLSPRDPDNWLGLGEVYQRENRFDDALDAMNQAVKLDPKRADLYTARARVLAAMGKLREARSSAQQALELDSSNAEARSELASLRSGTKHQLRFGMDTDLFNFTSANRGQWVSLASRWTPHWTTNVAGNSYQIAGMDAGKFIGSFTLSKPRWGALTLGGAAGHDNGVIPENEVFFEADHGWRLSETAFVRGLEITYGQHWYWYAGASILTLNQNSIVYLPRDWMWSLGVTGARSHFAGTGLDWKPSGMSKLTFPVRNWGPRNLAGNIFFAVGTEDFAQVDQIGSFSSHTCGGGFRFQINARQDVTGYAAYQQRERGLTDTAFGWSYGVRF